jgi:O-glycosyl hydrolase
MSFQWTAWIPRCVAALLLFSGAVRAAAEEPARRVKVDLRRGFQAMDNFGASDCWSMQMLGAWSLENRERVADLLFSREKGIGLSCWRFNLGAGKNLEDIPDPWRTVETFEVSEGVYDWTRQAGEQWFLGAAKARGVRQFVAFANSPPARMTRNGLTRCTKGSDSTNLQDGHAPQFRAVSRRHSGAFSGIIPSRPAD